MRLRERSLGQRGEGGRRREGKERRGHRSRARASSELKVKDPGGDGRRIESLDAARRLGKWEGGRGTLADGRRLYMRLALAAGGLGSPPPRADRVIWPVLVPCHGPGRRPKHGTGPRAVPARARGPACLLAHGPCQMSVLRAVPAAHGPDGNLYWAVPTNYGIVRPASSPYRHHCDPPPPRLTLAPTDVLRRLTDATLSPILPTTGPPSMASSEEQTSIPQAIPNPEP
jgi:hypothetical protein